MKFDLDINEIGEPSSDDEEEDVAQGKDGAMIFFKVNPSIIWIWREKNKNEAAITHNLIAECKMLSGGIQWEIIEIRSA